MADTEKMTICRLFGQWPDFDGKVNFLAREKPRCVCTKGLVQRFEVKASKPGTDGAALKPVEEVSAKIGEYRIPLLPPIT
jgi:hypothetical protein